MCSSIIISANICDLPEPRPPQAPLYRAGSNKGKAHRGVCICKTFLVKDDTFDPFNFQRKTIITAQLKLVAVLLGCHLTERPLTGLRSQLLLLNHRGVNLAISCRAFLVDCLRLFPSRMCFRTSVIFFSFSAFGVAFMLFTLFDFRSVLLDDPLEVVNGVLHWMVRPIQPF